MGQPGERAEIGMQEQVASLRLSRDDLEKWVRAPVPHEGLVQGCFVKVLLEGEADRRKYRLARIEGCETAGHTYIFGNLTSTNKLLCLNFGPFNAAYQMNTISNSAIAQEEVEDWLKSARPPLPPELAQGFLAAKQAQIAAFRASADALPTQRSAANPLPGSSSPGTGDAASIPRTAHAMDEEANLAVPEPQHHTKRRLVEKEKERWQEEAKRENLLLLVKQKDAVIRQREALIQQLQLQLSLALMPMDLERLSLAELATVEQQAEEYRLRVRAAMVEKSKCSICMERESIIVFYPCKHTITCDACSRAISICPLCRSPINDRITPYK